MKKVKAQFNINDEKASLFIGPNRTLLEVLREDLDLIGAKEGCGEGVCGSCTVLMDGAPVRSCLTLALEASGREILTVEGLAEENGFSAEGGLDPLQEAFIEHGAVQCGFCAPGMLMSAKGLLLADPMPDENKIRRAISGNICRCTGYAKIVDAISSVAEKNRG